MTEKKPDPSQGSGSQSAPTLELVNVRKVFKSDLLKAKQVALDNLSCRFAGGLCTGLLGHNGAGKTTAIRLILGLIKADAGEVRLSGRKLTTADKRLIGYMPEVNKLPPVLTPEEVLRQQLKLCAPAGIKSRAARKAAIEAKLAEVGLTGHAKKRIGHLSKGMARRLAWAQATIHEPRLLILDEPASGLDPLGRRRMLAWIEAEKRRGTTIVLCTHELQQMAALCDDFHVLRRGQLAFTSHKGAGDAGKTAGVTWRHRYTIHVSGLDEPALKRLREAEKLSPAQAVRHEGFLAILGFADYEQASRWLSALLSKGYVVTRFGDETSFGEDELLPYFEGEP